METKFSANLKKLRLQHKLLQSELADKLKTTQRKISYWESGKIEPDMKALVSISAYFRISIDDLIKEEM